MCVCVCVCVCVLFLTAFSSNSMPCSGCSTLHGVNPNFKSRLWRKTRLWRNISHQSLQSNLYIWQNIRVWFWRMKQVIPLDKLLFRPAFLFLLISQKLGDENNIYIHVTPRATFYSKPEGQLHRFDAAGLRFHLLYKMVLWSPKRHNSLSKFFLWRNVKCKQFT